MLRVRYLFILAVFILSGCKKLYNPPIIGAPSSYLVVEGLINTGGDSTFIKLSRTVNLSGKSTVNPEQNAIVTIENDQNESYPLWEVKSGVYSAAPLPVDVTKKYRVRITASDSKEYLSDLAESKTSPPIDSVNYKIDGNALKIFAATHDAENKSRYYRWDYVETWQFHANYNSEFFSNGDTILPRPPGQQIYYCFANAPSESIILGSSARLSQDIINQAPITRISSISEKLEAKYSILVRQYALTKEAFDFWQELQKNTESLGSIFDAQPSSSLGNIHCVSNPDEHVLGYISAGSYSTKRIFISASQLPLNWISQSPYSCEQLSAYFDDPKTHENTVAELLLTPGFNNITSQIVQKVTVIGYHYSSIECTDCTIRGTVKPPDFWK